MADIQEALPVASAEMPTTGATAEGLAIQGMRRTTIDGTTLAWANLELDQRPHITYLDSD